MLTVYYLELYTQKVHSLFKTTLKNFKQKNQHNLDIITVDKLLAACLQNNLNKYCYTISHIYLFTSLILLKNKQFLYSWSQIVHTEAQIHAKTVDVIWSVSNARGQQSKALNIWMLLHVYLYNIWMSTFYL